MTDSNLIYANPNDVKRNKSRQVLPDEMRGVALLGIAISNSQYLAYSFTGFDSQESPSARVITFLISLFISGKLFLIFAFMVGYSAHFIIRDGSRSRKIMWLKRLVFLGLLGILNVLFLFVGDILTTYAILGLALLVICRIPDRPLLKLGFVLIALAAVVIIVFGYLRAQGVLTVTTNLGPELAAKIASENPIDEVPVRYGLAPYMLFWKVSYMWLLDLAMLILGYVAGRKSLLTRVSSWRYTPQRIISVAGPIGLGLFAAAYSLDNSPGESLIADIAIRTMLYEAIILASSLSLALTYGCLTAFISSRWPTVLKPTVYIGRCTLSAYVFQSVCFLILVAGWGGGWFGTLTVAQCVAASIAIWFLLSLSFYFWLRRFAKGPLETVMAWFAETKWTGSGSGAGL